MEQNKQTYSRKKVVEHYKGNHYLQKPEITILNLLKTHLTGYRMLDIGVGMGRTSNHFAPFVKEYIGIDYSEPMISFCKNELEPLFPNSSFMTLDVRNLNSFIENNFDFALFSFNGIDYITHEDRLTALKQIKKVLKSNGKFCFSTHNIQAVKYFFNIPFSFNVYGLLKTIISKFKVLRINRKQIAEAESRNFLILNDGAHDFGLNTYYVRPSYQIKILNEIGFQNVSVFSLTTGNELLTSKQINESADKWLYYLCS